MCSYTTLYKSQNILLLKTNPDCKEGKTHMYMKWGIQLWGDWIHFIQIKVSILEQGSDLLLRTPWVFWLRGVYGDLQDSSRKYLWGKWSSSQWLQSTLDRALRKAEQPQRGKTLKWKQFTKLVILSPMEKTEAFWKESSTSSSSPLPPSPNSWATQRRFYQFRVGR